MNFHRTFVHLLAGSLALGVLPTPSFAAAPPSQGGPGAHEKKEKPPKKPKKGQVAAVSEEDANNPAAFFQQGSDLLAGDKKGVVDYAAARDAFQKAADLGGGKKAWFNVGWASEQLGNPADAEKAYRKAVEADVTYQPALFSLARVLKSAGKAADVASLFKKYYEAVKTVDARVLYMDSLSDAGQYDEAIAQGQDLLRENPNNDAVYRIYSSMYLSQGRVSMARVMGDKALELNDKDPDVYNNMGVVFLQNGNQAQAIEKFEMARTLDTTHYEANMNIGLIALNSGDYGRALDSFNNALQRNPNSNDAKLAKAVALRGTGDLTGAAALYDAIIRADKNNRVAYFNAATLEERYVKDFTKATKYLEEYKNARAGQLSPNDEVFTRLTAVATAKAADEARKAEEKAKAEAEAERKERAKALLAGMQKLVDDMSAKLTANSACIPEEVSMEITMALDTAKDTIAQQDTDNAADVQGLLESYYVPMLDQTVADNCTSAAPAAPPAPEPPADGAAAPAEAPPEAPAEAPADATTPAPQ